MANDSNKKGIDMPKPKYLGKYDYKEWPEFPSEDIWKDYKKHRRSMRAPITQTVINRLGKQLTIAWKAGYSVDNCLGEAMEAGWRGLKAEWIFKRCQRDRPVSNNQQNDYGDY